MGASRFAAPCSAASTSNSPDLCKVVNDLSHRLTSHHIQMQSQGHVLYPTSICLSDFLAENATQYVEGKNVLELGAGGGLPGVISVLEGAAKVS